jgi:tRNA-splicing ligase RtcB (3'-phosphate/5'-hydroxy nucleic acid ligase)
MNGPLSTATLSLPATTTLEESTRVSGKLVAMSLGDPLEASIEAKLEEIAALPYVSSVLALPDAHWKAKMEVPSSIAIATRDAIVPEFTSADVNDGMGVVATGLSERDATPERLERFFASVNAHSSAHFFDRNRYSLSKDDLIRAVREGAAGVLDRYGMDAAVLDAFEDGGGLEIDGEGDAFRQTVPLQLLATAFSRSEMGLNFGGNHFLEVQAVDEVLDPVAARAWGLEKGQVVVMYHLGPGPFAGTLLHHFSRRTKLKRERVPLFFLSKLLFHYGQRAGNGDPRRKWDLHFRQNGWTPFPVGSEEGAFMANALALANNFGHAYRLATVRAIMDGIAETVSKDVPTRLFCDISHNGVQEERWNGTTSWIARHNACRLAPNRPTLVAGSYDVPSYLGLGGSGCDGRFHSYDHGAGNLIEHYRTHGLLRPVQGSVHRFRMTRGKDARIERKVQMSLSASEPIDRLMECLEQHDVMRSVVRLRPLGNFKN